ncbi:AfsR/SARP family transcriptional regulator [Kutzneria albida]|uniref:SARP family transcription regulator n=1 Tax=Kutzneria albida DSM 43870 TaxID=1449976 RepID=W5W046_9PSEU|nr:BTAD domain-containing putative transcriptional regulator [Kutzneria albida]AHH93931.1 SARP family transcription regulator [Kutzneria albida DSM 43870]
MPGDVRFRILGPLEVSLSGQPVPIRAAKHRTLLAALLLRANRVVPVEALVERLWADDPPARAKGTLQTYVLRLRQALGDPDLVRTAPEGYYIDVPPGAVDLERFRQLTAEGARATDAGDLAAAAEALDAALRLWRGAPLADVPSDSLQRNVVPQLVEQHLQVLERRIDIELRRGRHTELIAELQSLTAKHPTRERFWAQLMLALYRGGRQAEALAAYQSVARHFAEELGIDPGEQLRRLHQGMLTNAPELLAPVQPETARPVVFPSQLPADIPDFVGRTELVDGLVQAFDQGSVTGPVVFVGPPGVGKTALAVHVAHRLRARFPDGQLYVNLRGYALGPALSTAQVLSRFLRALGVPPEQIPIEVDHQAATFRALVSDKRMLVVLDNAATAEQVRVALPAGPGCAVLVTSRNDLRVRAQLPGARTVVLEPLAPSESLALLDAVLGTGTDRAEGSSAELAALCAHLPLALRIAAANLAKALPSGIEDYVAELRNGNRLAVLSIDGDEGTAVRAAFDLSYTTLDAKSRELFRALGLVPGPDFTAPAAAALVACSPGEAAGLLDQLAAVHLVQQHSPGRYQFHDLIRLYASQRDHEENTTAEREAAVGRLFDHYLDAAGAAARVVHPDLLRLPPRDPAQRAALFADVAEATEWLDAERANLVAAIGHAARQDMAEHAVRITDSLRGYFLSNRHNVDWFASANAALSVARRGRDRRAEAAMLHNLGTAHWNLDQHDEAIGCFSAALAAYREVGAEDGIAAALNNLGAAHIELGQFAEATEHLEASLEVARHAGFRETAVVTHGNLGFVHLELGRLAEAIEYSSRAAELCGEAGLSNCEATSLANLGAALLERGSPLAAIERFTEALAKFRALGKINETVEALHGLASAYQLTAQADLALEHAHEALTTARRTGNRRCEAMSLAVLGMTWHSTGRYAEAMECFEEAVEVIGEIRHPRTELRVQIGMAMALPAVGRLAEGLEQARTALDLARAKSLRLYEARTSLLVAHLLLLRGDTEQAHGYAVDALEIYREVGNPIGEAWSIHALAKVHRARGEEELATSYLQTALKMLDGNAMAWAERIRAALAS